MDSHMKKVLLYVGMVIDTREWILDWLNDEWMHIIRN